eukprot:478097_1
MFYMFSLLLLILATNECHGAWQLLDYDPVADPKAIIHSGTSARFTVLTSSLIRLEYDSKGKFEDRQSFTIFNRKLAVPKFTNTSNNGILTIKTSDLTLTYAEGQKFNSTSLTIDGHINGFNFTYKPSDKGIDYDNSISQNLLGTVNALDTIHVAIPLNCTITGKNYCSWAVIGRMGYALINDTKSAMLDGNWLSEKDNYNTYDWYFFGHGMNYKQALKDFSLISGKHSIVPRYALGSWHSRWYDYSDLSAKQVVENYESREIPLDIFVWDMNWHLYGPWGCYTWNPALYPFYNLTQAWMNKKGLRTTANIHDDNGIQNYEMYYKQAAAALGVTNGQGIAFNVTDENYMLTLQDIIQTPIMEQSDNSYNGFDFWWIDWQQGENTGVYYTTINPTLWLNYVRHTTHIRRKENIRGLVLGRYGGYGNQRYAVGFSGDNGHSWQMLQWLPYFTSTAANVAYEWSHDIMGENNANDKNEANTRWIQFGAFSPVFRIHDRGVGEGGCANNENGCELVDIWTHPWTNIDIERNALQQRAELLPYLYNASYELFTDNIQLTRPIYYEYPTLDIAYQVGYEYYLGNNMIISPVANPSGDGGVFNLSQQQIYLPPNQYFYELHSGYYYLNTDSSGGKPMNRSFDLSEIPIYIVASSVISLQPFIGKKCIGRANNNHYEHILWDIFPKPTMDDIYRETFIMEDDGYTNDYLKNINIMTKFKWNLDTNNQFTASVISTGNYSGFESNRRYSIKIHNILPPKSVSCNGNVLTYNKLYYGNKNDESTWFYDGKEMALIANCQSTNAFDITSITMNFNRNWIDDLKITNGMKGKINRAIMCKQSLDERNVNYGTDRVNLTTVAGYSTSLGYVGADYNTFYNMIKQFNDLYNNAVKEVDALNVNSVGLPRLQYCLNLLQTIYQ